MKRLILFLAVVTLAALIVTTGNYEINTSWHAGPAIADGSAPPPPPWPPKPTHPRPTPHPQMSLVA